jgi:rSAM/selenodomain-associated transferase 1
MYHILCNWTREQALGLTGADRHLYYSDEIMEPDAWPAEDFHKQLQHPGGLGERMSEGFRAAFAAGYQRVIIIGSDCPGIDSDYLQAALVALENDDVVIGPALDGGYTLLGMRSFIPSLFTDVAWSTAEVLPTTLARAAAADKTVHKLKPLSDVDYLEDWLGYGWAMPE